MNPIKELKKRRLNTAQRVLNIFLQGAFCIILLILISQVMQNEVFNAIENNKEKIAGEITQMVLEQEIEKKEIELNEKQMEESKLLLKKEILNQTNEALSIVKKSIQEKFLLYTNILSQDKIILILIILLVIIFINSGLLLTSYFVSKTILCVGIMFILPKILLQVIFNKEILNRLFSSLINNSTDQKIMTKFIEIFSDILNPVFQKYFFLGLMMIIAAIVLQIPLKAIAKRKTLHIKQREGQN